MKHQVVDLDEAHLSSDPNCRSTLSMSDVTPSESEDATVNSELFFEEIHRRADTITVVLTKIMEREDRVVGWESNE